MLDLNKDNGSSTPLRLLLLLGTPAPNLDRQKVLLTTRRRAG